MQEKNTVISLADGKTQTHRFSVAAPTVMCYQGVFSLGGLLLLNSPQHTEKLTNHKTHRLDHVDRINLLTSKIKHGHINSQIFFSNSN